MSDERQERDEREEKREERGEKREERRGCIIRMLCITAILMCCRPNFGLTQIQPELGYYLA